MLCSRQEGNVEELPIMQRTPGKWIPEMSALVPLSLVHDPPLMSPAPMDGSQNSNSQTILVSSSSGVKPYNYE